MNILVIDIGTTSIRGIVYTQDGLETDVHSIQTPLLTDPDTGFIEQSPALYERCAAEIARVLGQRCVIDAVSITAYRSAPTLVDREGHALCNFIMWQDTRNSAICRRLQPHSRLIYEKSGARLNTVFTASKMTWLRENEPELWNRAYKAMIVPDYIIRFMTGVFATDRTYGSRTHVMDIRTLEWDADMCRLFNIPQDKLCELRNQGTVIGHVSAAFSGITGLKQGIPVISAGGDQQCGALGMGVLDSSTIEVNSGTGSFVISLTNEPTLENEAVICNVAAEPGMYTQEMNIIASASAVNWLIREFFPEYWSETPDFDAVNRIAEETPPGAHGLYAVPLFQGCGSRDWNPEATATFSGFTLSSRRGDMIRALYEGIAAEIAKSIDALPERCRKAQEIAVAGGLSCSDIYNRILCEMTGRRLIRSRNAQATALGAFISASVALGLFSGYREAWKKIRDSSEDTLYQPDPEMTAFYQGYKKHTEQLYRASLVKHDA